MPVSREISEVFYKNSCYSDMLLQQAGILLIHEGKPLALEPEAIYDVEKRNMALERLISPDTGDLLVVKTNELDNILRITGATRSLAKSLEIRSFGDASITPNKKNHLKDDFMREALQLNELRVLREISEGGVNLFDTKVKISKLKLTYGEVTPNMGVRGKQRLTYDFNRRLEELIIPCANSLAKVFPKRNSAIHTSAILEKSESNCAGKTNIMIILAKYLGLKARSANVLLSSGNAEIAHEAAVVDLFGEESLVVDANWSSHHYLRGVSGKSKVMTEIRKRRPLLNDDQIQGEYERWLQFNHLNEPYIAESSDVLVYSISKVRDQNHLPRTRHISLDNGSQEWFASIPYPHMLLSLDINGTSMNHYNLGVMLKAWFGECDRAVDAYQIALKYSPHPQAHNNLGNIFRHYGNRNAAEWHYRTALSINPREKYKRTLRNLLS